MEDKVLVCCKVTGCCVSIGKVTNEGVKALKNWISHLIRTEDSTDLVVMKGTLNMKMLLADHIKRCTMDEEAFSEFRVVGVATKDLVDICMLYRKIRPLHLCQEIAYNISNTEFAIKNGDRELAEEYQSERLKFYAEAKKDYNLNMVKLNRLMWEEFDHIINNYKDYKTPDLDLSWLTDPEDDEEFLDHLEREIKEAHMDIYDDYNNNPNLK